MTKLKFIILSTVTVLTFTSLFLSCSNDEITEQVSNIEKTSDLKELKSNDKSLVINEFFGENLFEFKANKDGFLINSKFTVRDKLNNVIYETKFSFDEAKEHYKLYQSDKVLEIASKLNFDLQLEDYSNIVDDFQLFMNNTISKYQGEKNLSILHSLFFHNSILNIKKRKLKGNNNDCNCTTIPTYLLDKTGFYCQEDYLVNVHLLRQVISKNKSEFSDERSTNLINYLSKVKTDFISFEKYYEFYFPKKLYVETLTKIKYNENQNKSCGWWCPLGCGSDPGCCGNYSGCCLFWSANCLAHDIVCTWSNCQPVWACFPGCQIP